MSRKNFKVATTEDGKTTLTKIDKTPTGKVKTIKDREKIKKEREEQYKNFRIGALKRRAKRMGLSDEDTEKKIEELKTQLDTPNSYIVLVLFKPDDKNLVVEALKNEGLTWKMMSNSHFYIEADQETLGTLRGIMPPSAKIHPYVKKKPPILQAEKKVEEKKPKNRAAIRTAAKAAKKARKVAKMNACKNRKKNQGKAWAKVQKRIKLLAAKKKRKATTVQLNAKKRSMDLKKASTNLKKAA